MPFLYEHMNFAPFQKMAAVVRFKEHTTSMQDGCRKSALQVTMVFLCPFLPADVFCAPALTRESKKDSAEKGKEEWDNE